MKIRGLLIGMFTMLFLSSMQGQNAHRINADIKSINEHKLACADQFAGTIHLGSINAQSNRIDLQDTTFLCYLDMFEIIHDGNQDLTGDPEPATIPGIGYLWYDCPPVISGPDLSSIRIDNCLIATPPPVSDLWAYVDEINGDAKFSNGNNNLGGTLSTVPDYFNGGYPFQAWFAPVTFDDAANLGFESDGIEQGPCVNVNTSEAFTIVYLNPIEVINKNVIDLSGNPYVAQFEIQGGLPEFNGSDYTDIEIIKTTNNLIRGTLMDEPYTDGDVVTFTVPEEGEYIITIEDSVSCGVSESFLISQNNDGITFDIGDASGLSGEIVCLPFTVQNFDSIEVFQFTINFDPNYLCYDSFSDIRLIGFDLGAVNLINVDRGEIRIVWIDPNLFEGDGVSIPDGEKIWDLCLMMKGTCSEICTNVTITGSPLSIEVQNANTELLETFIDPGEVCIAPGTALTICPTSCSTPAGEMGGSLSFSITGGTPPYNYSGDVPAGTMNTAGETVSLGGLAPGDYVVNVTDNMGTMTSVTITIRDAPSLSIDSIFIRDPRCFGYADGRIRIEEVTGGNESEPYSYQWSNFLFNVTQLDDLPQGAYTVTVTDADGCTDEEMVILEADPLDPGITVMDQPTCDGICNGIIRVRPTGGVPINGNLYNYNVQWKNINDQILVVSGTGLQRTIGNICDTVNIQIGDANGCLDESTFEIPYDKVLSVQANANDILCFGDNTGQIEATVISNGDPLTDPIQFHLMDTMMTTIEDVSGAANNHIFTDIPEDEYLLEITDGDGCLVDTLLNISEPPELILNYSTSGLDCSGTGNDGKIVLDISGGVEPYDILWESGETMDSLENLGNGIYMVTVTDANLCTVADTVDLTMGGNLVLQDFEVQHLACHGDSTGSISLMVNSNGSNVEYLWNTGAMTSSINMLESGEYKVTISNEIGCVILDTFMVNEPDPLSIIVNPDEPNCPGENGNLSIIVEGGTGEPTILWEHNNFVGPTLPGIPAGEYMVTIADENLCQIVRNVILNDADSIQVNIDAIVGISCNGENTGQATATASGGTVLSGDYNFEWSSGETATGANHTATGLAAEEQWLLVNDGLCSTDTMFFDVPVADSIKLLDDMSTLVDPSCYGISDGSATVMATGGDGNFSYNWIDAGQSGPSANNLGVGVHYVEITDGQNCTALDSIILSQPDSLEAMINVLANVRCSDSEDGILQAQIIGGNAGSFNYQWSGTSIDSSIINEMSAGMHSVTVTDSRGCTGIAEVELIAPPPVVASIDNVPQPNCFGDRVCLGVDNYSGGAGVGYSFQINRGPEINIDTCVNLLSGVYTITVLDTLGCIDEFDIEIPQAPEFSVDLGDDEVIDLGDSIVIDALISGIVATDSIFWNPITDLNCQTMDCHIVEASPVSTMVYEILVTDMNGCEARDEIMITVNQNRHVFLPNAFSLNSADFDNSEFRIYTGNGVESIDYLRIYDRWGNMIFELENLIPSKFGTEGWDGTYNGEKVNPGVYVYFTQINFENGTSLVYKGSVTVLR